MNNEKIPTSININWARHIYAKLSLNPYKIKELEKWVFTHFYKNMLNLTDIYKKYNCDIISREFIRVE